MSRFSSKPMNSRYFDNRGNSTVHKQIDLTNLNVDLCSIEGTLYLVLSYV